jgi:hypothetical protein
MSPDERQLLVDLFDRIRQGSISPRDREAESFISDQVLHSPMRRCWRRRSSSKIKPLRAAHERLQQLEQRVQEIEGEGGRPVPGTFLGGLGSLFGGGHRNSPPPAPPSRWGGAPQAGAPGYGQSYGGQQPYPGPASGGPWPDGGAPDQQQGGGGGFLKGALGAAAGVAGGVLMADSIRGLFRGAGNPFGIGSSFGGLGGGKGSGAGGDPSGPHDVLQDQDPDHGKVQHASDFGSDDDYGGDDNFDV